MCLFDRYQAINIVYPSATLPKTTCLLSNQGRGTVVIKNWLPFALGLSLAMDNKPGSACLSWKFSSSRSVPIILNKRHWGLRFLNYSMTQIRELTIDGFTTSTVAIDKITTLKHEIWNNMTKFTFFVVSKALSTNTKNTEVLSSLWDNISGQLKDNTLYKRVIQSMK